MAERESCDRHAHSIFRPCVNGSNTFDYLLDAQAPLYVPDHWDRPDI